MYFDAVLKPIYVSRIVSAWMGMIAVLMACIAKGEGDDRSKFYRFGPQPDLVILGYAIDTPAKYAWIIVYALLNTTVRNMNHNIITPWITLNVQDMSPEACAAKKRLNVRHVYELSIVSTLYSWFDWLIYINMLLAQVDMMIIEMGTDVLAMMVITYGYMNVNVDQDVNERPKEKREREKERERELVDTGGGASGSEYREADRLLVE